MCTLIKKPLLTIISIGLSLGILGVFSPGSLFCIFIMVLIILRISSISDSQERIFLSRLFILGVIVRIALTLLIQFIFISQQKWTYYEEGVRAITLFGDDGFNNIVGWWIAQYVSGKQLSDYLLLVVSSSIGEYGRNGYLYLVSLFHYLFGYSPISVVFLNCIISALTGIVYYFITKKIADVKTAKISATLVTFFPSLIFWSTLNLKEPFFIFLVGVILLSFLHLLDNNKIKYIILLILLIILQYYLRKFVLLITPLILVFAYLIIKKKLKIAHIILSLIILIIALPLFKNKLDDLKLRTVSYHLGVVSSGGSTYRLYDDWVYQPGAPTAEVPYFEVVKGSLRGWVHFFLEPFPWKISSKLSLVCFPQMLIWYCLMPFSLIGILTQLRYNWNKSLVLVVYFLTMGSFFSLTGGNIGTDFRMRDALTPLTLLFSSIGIINFFYFKPNTPEAKTNP